MTEGSPDNIQEMLTRAELALVQGNFIKASLLSRTAGSIMDRTQQLHRKFLKKMRGFLDKVQTMESWGYDVSEAKKIMDRARDKAVKSDYEKAMDTISLVDTALERATYLPFPLLNKTVDIISTITYSGGRLSYSIRIENPTMEPLGEIIIRPFLQEGDFQEVPERYYGLIGPREFKESTFILTPKGKEWNIGVGREVLMGEGVMLRTKLSSMSGTAKYFITIENNSDQIIRDVTVSPMAPGGLEADPREAVMEFVEPFASKTVEFDLMPSGKVKAKVLERKKVEKVVILEDESVEDERSWTKPPTADKKKEAAEPDSVDWDVEEEPPAGAPRDFTPVKEEYDLISMAPYHYGGARDKVIKPKGGEEGDESN